MTRNPFSTSPSERRFLARKVREARADLKANGYAVSRANVSYLIASEGLQSEAMLTPHQADFARSHRIARMYAEYLDR